MRCASLNRGNHFSGKLDIFENLTQMLRISQRKVGEKSCWNGLFAVNFTLGATLMFSSILVG